MALGKQFENTYWNNPETGKNQSWEREVEDGVPAAAPTFRKDGFGNFGDAVKAPSQGMLFHPLTGTGRKEDPLVPLSEREDAVRTALNLNDPKEYRTHASYNLKKRISSATAASDSKVLTRGLVDSGMSIDEIKKSNVKPFLDKSLGGYSEPLTSTIMVGKRGEQGFGKKKDSTISKSTLVHEMGHQKDTNLRDTFGHRYRRNEDDSIYADADPLEEGFADGYNDKHEYLANAYEDQLDRPGYAVDSTNGYGVENHNWRSATYKALYVASRINARTGSGDDSQYKRRADVMSEIGRGTAKQETEGMTAGPDKVNKMNEISEIANTMSLGQMINAKPNLMKHLDFQNLGDVGRKARSSFVDAHREHNRTKKEAEGTQGELDLGDTLNKTVA